MSRLHIIAPLEWAAALALQLGNYSVEITHPESLSELGVSRGLTNHDFLVVHVETVSLADALRFLVWQREFLPEVRTAVVGPVAVVHEWLIRDLGAIAVVGRTWHGQRLARMIRRHFELQPVESSGELLETWGLS